MKKISLRCFAIAAFILPLAQIQPQLLEQYAFAQNQALPVAQLASAMGKVFILRSGEKLSSAKGMKLYASDQIVTGPNSVAKIVFADGSNFVVLQEGSVEVEAYWTEAHGTKTAINSMFNLVRGKARFFFKPREGGHEGYVKTANAIMGVRGTAFFVDSGNGGSNKDGSKKEKTELIVLSGVVAVHNPQKPEAEVMVKANEATTIASEAPPAPPALANTAEIAVLEKQATALPERIPDGEPAKEIELPPPTMPNEREQTRNTDSVQIQRGTVIKQIITPQYMVLPTNAVVASKAGISCDKTSLEKFKIAAQNISPDAPLMGSELAQCPGLQSESIFWLGFHHIARGEKSRAAELPRILRSKNIPLDVQTERAKLFQKALEGNTSELLKAVQEKNSPFAQDTEALLTLARALTIVGNHTEAAKYYAAAENVPTLTGNTDIKIERGYALLLKGDYERASNTFAILRDYPLSTYQNQAVARGIGLSEYKKMELDGSERDSILFAVENTEDLTKWSKGGITAKWNSSVANLVARSGDLKREILKTNSANNNQTPEKIRYGELLAGKSFKLSSGMEIDALAGLSQVDKLNDFEAEMSAAYRFKNGLGFGGEFQRLPISFTRMVPAYAQNWQFSTFSFVTNFKRPTDSKFIAEGKLSYSTIGEFDSVVAANVLGRIPVHTGMSTADFLNLKGEIGFRSHSANMREYESPNSELQYLGGAEWGWKPFSWAQIGLNFDAGFISRDARDGNYAATVSQSERDAYTNNEADTRDTITNESFTVIAPNLTFLPTPAIKLFVNAQLKRYQNSTADNEAWKSNTFFIGAQWNYNTSAP